jgi:hypothetical protein
METGNYQVSGLRVKTSTGLNANGDPVQTIVVSYMIGPHGPFIDVYGFTQYSKDAAIARITAKVNEFRLMDQQLTQLNQQTKSTY